MTTTTTAAAHPGPYVLNNHILLESIIAELPEFADIISLLQVSREVSSQVQSVFARSARHVSFKDSRLSAARIMNIFHHPLKSEPAEPYRRLLDDGRVILVGGGPAGTPYINSWRHLRELDFSGTHIDTTCVKVFIGACAGGQIPGLTQEGVFSKDFPAGMLPGAMRILRDQGLRLTRLSVVDCENVDIHEVNVFLRKILAVVTAPRREQLKRLAQGNAQNTLNVFVNPALNAANNNAQNNPPPNAAVHGQGNAIPDALVSVGMMEDDFASIPSPLPGCVEDLEDWGLPCLSLRRLEVANVSGLYVFPSSKYRGRKEWNYLQECPYARNVAHLNVVAGCLGIDVDVIFCQGSGCTGDYGNDKQRVLSAPGDHRMTYKDPLPRLPGERILINDTDRIFRIPKHCIQEPAPSPPPVSPHHNPFPAALLHQQAQTYGNPLTYGNPFAIQPHAMQGIQQNNQLAGGYHPNATAGVMPWVQLQTLQHLHPQPHPHPPTIPGGPLPPHLDLMGDDDDSDDDFAAGLAQYNIPPPSMNNNQAMPPPPHILFGNHQLHTPHQYHQPLQPQQPQQYQPHAQHNQPVPGLGLSLSLRRSLRNSLDDGPEPQPTMIRSVAMIDGPRGLCEGCGKEVWLCEKCNAFWNVCCGGCASQVA